MRNLKSIILIICCCLPVFMVSCSKKTGIKYKYYDNKPVWAIGGEFIKKLNTGEFEDLENYINLLAARKSYTVDGTRVLEYLYQYVGKRIHDSDMLDKWCAKEPSHYSAFIFRGNYYIVQAWKHRGSDLGYTVTEEGRRLFTENLLLAEKDFNKAYSMNPADPNSAASMITVYKGLRRYEEEMDTWFKRAIEADPVAYYAYAKKQDFLRPKWGGTKEKDFAFAEYCDKNAPPKSVVHEIMLDYLMEKARWERKDFSKYYNDPGIKKIIDDVVQRTLKNFPDSASIRSKLAEIETSKGNYEKAVELYTEILEKDQGNPGALHMRAKLYAVNLGKLDLAESDINRSLESDPEGPDIFDDMAMIAYISSNYEKAIEYYTRAIERKPKYKQFYLLRGSAKISAYQDYSSAVEDFKNALRLDPLLTTAYRLTAQCLQKLNQPEEAKKYYQMALDIAEAQKAGGNRRPSRIPPELAEKIEKMLNMSLSKSSLAKRKIQFPMAKRKFIYPVSEEILSQYAGTYELSPEMNIVIALLNTRLVCQLPGQRITPLFPESETKFFNPQNRQIRIEFFKDDSGEVMTLALTQDGVEKKAVRTSDKIYDRKEITVPAEILSQYVGTYELNPPRVIEITMTGNRLFAQTTGFIKKAISPESESKFFYRIVDAQLEFFRDESGKVSHLVLTQGNSVVKAPRKQVPVVSIPDNYGLSEKTAIKTGGGPRGERAYLDKLSGPNGEKISYRRLGSCCAFKSSNAQFNNTGLLDIYEVTYEGISKPVHIYLNMYDPPTGEFFSPPGFKLKN